MLTIYCHLLAALTSSVFCWLGGSGRAKQTEPRGHETSCSCLCLSTVVYLLRETSCLCSVFFLAIKDHRSLFQFAGGLPSFLCSQSSSFLFSSSKVGASLLLASVLDPHWAWLCVWSVPFQAFSMFYFLGVMRFWRLLFLVSFHLANVQAVWFLKFFYWCKMVNEIISPTFM